MFCKKMYGCDLFFQDLANEHRSVYNKDRKIKNGERK